MTYRLRDIEAECKFSSALSLQAIGEVVTNDLIAQVIAQHQAEEDRERKLSMSMVVWVIIAMNLFAHLSIGRVIRKASQGLRFIWSDPDLQPANKSAFCYRRYQLGPAVLADLFKQLTRPLAQPDTPGAFLFGYRLMAIDGTVDCMPDTQENDAFFGRASTDRGPAAFPQVRSVYLAECGTHAVIDAEFMAYNKSEYVGARAVLRSIQAGMLVMWDRGLHAFDMFVGVLARDAQVLSRLPSYVQPQIISRLPDGSQLAWLKPPQEGPYKHHAPIKVRLISYTLSDAALPGYGETHRVVTTLLDWEAAPALEIACAYHERWEIEILIDEVQTHQRLHSRPLRSKKPAGVMQELYGLLIAHYAVRQLMLAAAATQGIDPDRLSFVNALSLLQDAIPEFQMVAASERPRLYARLLADIVRERLPERKLRSNPRVVKRKMSNFKLKRPQHDNWPQPTMPFRHAVFLI